MVRYEGWVGKWGWGNNESVLDRENNMGKRIKVFKELKEVY